MLDDFFVELATWSVDEDALRELRTAVFIEEQGIPNDEEFDEFDPESTHFLAKALDDGGVIGTARLSVLPDQQGRIGRIAVRNDWRGRGVGGSLLRTAIETASTMAISELLLSAQVNAIPFYEKFGFAAEPERYLDGGIPHQMMRRTVATPGVHQRNPQRRQIQPSGDATAAEFHGLGEQRAAVLRLLQATSGELLIYTRDLEHLVLGNSQVIQQLADLANQSPPPTIRVIVHDPDRAIKEGHLLLPLAQRKPGTIDFRLPSKSFQSYAAGFVVGDRRHCLFREVATYPEGEIRFNDTGYATPLVNYFRQVWDFGEHDSNLRALHL